MSSAALRLPDDPSQLWADALLRDGYCIIPDAVPVSDIATLHDDLKPAFAQAPFCSGDFFGSATKRFGGLLKRSPHVAALVQHKLVLDIVQAALGPHCERIQLNLTQAIEIWPGEPQQLPHRDQDMWPVKRGEMEYLVNVMWPLTPFRAENGATVIWPRSHRRESPAKLPVAESIASQMDPGSVLLFLGSTLHCGGANRTPLPRAGVLVSYSLGWLRTYENQFLVYPPDIARHFSPELASLVGYEQHRPSLGNVEGHCPSRLLRDAAPEYTQFTDALRDEQVKPLADYMARQRMLMQTKT